MESPALQPLFCLTKQKANNDNDGLAEMDDLLKPIKTVKKVQGNIEKFESLSLRENQPPAKEGPRLKSNPSKTKRSILEIDSTVAETPWIKAVETHRSEPIAPLTEQKGNELQTTKRHDPTVFLQQSYLKDRPAPCLPDNAREILQSQPVHEDLVAVLQFLECGIDGKHDFNVKVASPRAAQIINVLVTTTIPHIWANVKQGELSNDEAQIKKVIIASLSCVAGIGALLAQIKTLSAARKNQAILSDSVDVLGAVLKGQKTVLNFARNAPDLYSKETLRRMYWQEMTSLLAGSRVLSTLAETFGAFNTDSSLQSYVWLADGIEYQKWLAKNITTAAQALSASEEESWAFLSQLVKRGSSLGHRDKFVAEIYTRLLLGPRALWTPLHLLLKPLTVFEQKAFFDSVLVNLTRTYLAFAADDVLACSSNSQIQRTIAGAAALIAGLVRNNDALEEHVQEWLTGEHKSVTAIGLASRRALIAAFGRSEVKLQSILEKSLSRFGDKLQLQHGPIAQQEALAQTILLSIGHLGQIDKQILKRPSISTLAMHAVSNRLAASIVRTRLLGMIIGTAMSRIVDEQENVINFGVEEMESESTQRWLSLVKLDDQVGDVSDIHTSPSATSRKVASVKQTKPAARAVRKGVVPHSSKIVAIEEVSTSESEEDLVPYQRPDSDPEDSEDDATLINRNKPSAPVYITDLMKQLGTSEQPDILALALHTAPSLVRRKANFGTELSENVYSLVTMLVNLQDGMSDPELQQLRLESLIACLVAKPDLVGPSLASLYFQGDFSLAQRLAIMTAVGLAVRELAGFGDGQATQPPADFPSKRLPAHLEPQSAGQISRTRNPVEMLADASAHRTVRPMALAAADKMTGPSVLKIRTFSSRLEVEKKNQQKNAARTKSVPKDLHRMLTESFYVPLCSRMNMLLSYSIGGQLPNTTILHHSTLKLFLQTLTLTLHTLGPLASIHLPALTHETVLLLINLYAIPHLSTDPAILPALLHLLLALLDITVEAGLTAQERLITDHGAQMMELVNWSNSLDSKTSVPDTSAEGGGMPWAVLAAGIQVKWFEMSRRFQGRLLGLSVDEMDQLAGV